jgi:hypothetical protein
MVGSATNASIGLTLFLLAKWQGDGLPDPELRFGLADGEMVVLTEDSGLWSFSRKTQTAYINEKKADYMSKDFKPLFVILVIE